MILSFGILNIRGTCLTQKYPFLPLFSNVITQIIFIFFFTGDHPAAMYHEHRSAATTVYRKSSYRDLLLLLFLSILLAFYNATTCNIFSIFTNEKLPSLSVQKECPKQLSSIVAEIKSFSSRMTHSCT